MRVCVFIGEHVYVQFTVIVDYAKPALICMHARACVCVSAVAFLFIFHFLFFLFSSCYLRILFSKIYNDAATFAILEIKQKKS